uniref:Suppressor of cytokine signaling 7 n=1 Tax=Scophthalmus maximus TaxID=52904 RepID=A0A8D3BN27_SCOMX
MSDAQQEMSPDFVLMRLVSAAEFDELRAGGGFGPVKTGLHDRAPRGPSPGLGSASPHYSSPLPGKGDLAGGLVLTEAPLSPPPPDDFSVAAQRFVDFPVPHGRGSQLMVLQNLLRTGDRILEQRPPGLLQEEAETQGQQLDPGSGVPPLDPEPGSVLCQRHRLLTDRLAKWPPGLLDQALRLGLLEPRKNCFAGGEDPVLSLAWRLGQLGEGRQGGGEDTGLPPPQCSCHSVLASGTGGLGPGEDPGDTSDALLVLEGLGSEEVGRLGEGGGGDEGDAEKGERLGGLGGGGTSGGTGPTPAPPSALIPPVCTPLQPPADSKSSLNLSRTRATVRCISTSPAPSPRAVPPPLNWAWPQGEWGGPPPPLVVLEGEGGRTPRGKSRKGGSLKVRLSKLFRTKSSSGGSGGLLDKRPSLASSTSSGGESVGRVGVDLQHHGAGQVRRRGETVSLVDVDISRRGGDCLHPPTPPPPPRRSLSLLDDFVGPPQHQGPFTVCNVGASLQSLPPRPLVLPPSLSTIQHSLSLNEAFLRGLPRPVPLRPDGLPHPPRLTPRCPLSRPDASSFATSLRELEKCGWYWGPMNWEDAEMKLKGKPDGSFLVRDSSDPRYILSLSFRSQGVTHHTRMEHYRGTFSLWCHPKFEDRCHSVVEFIERAIMHSKNGKFLYFLRSRVPGLPPTPVQLLYPVSRFSSIKSLQHLCRFCIRQLVRIDHIQELPLPKPLIFYLRKFYYYDPEEEISPTLTDGGRGRSRQPGVESQT